MLPGEGAILWLPFYGTPSSYKGGTEGSHPSRFLHLNHQQTLTAIAFGSSGHYIGQENSRPRFGIIMTHLCSNHVVKSDFCCWLPCCYLSAF